MIPDSKFDENRCEGNHMTANDKPVEKQTQPEKTAPPQILEKTEQPAKSKLPLTLILLIILIGIGWFGVRYWRFASTHATTDNAYLTSDVTQIAPQVTGTVQKVLVKDNQLVKKGELLVVLDNSTYRAAYDQAKANLDVAIAQAQGAGISVNLTAETGTAQTLQAEGVVAQAQSGIASAKADVARAAAGVSTAIATAGSANAGIVNAESAVSAAIANKQKAQDAVLGAQAQLETAKAGLRAAQAGVDAGDTAYNHAVRDDARYAALRQQGAISEQMADQASTQVQTTRAQLENVRQQVAQAQSVIINRQADINAAKQQVQAADAAIGQAKAALTASKQQYKAMLSGIKQSEAARKAAQVSVSAAEARKNSAIGTLKQANTSPRQVGVSRSAQTQATAKIEQARAALQSAQILLNYTKIYAPVDGRVSKKSVEVGALVQPGTPLMALVPAEKIWVVANFKETQLPGMHIGSPTDIEVDAIPGKTFRGRVDSISAATGATFALLPPDNATGNFTKIVQRIPVKIVIDPGQPDFDKLRAGMSVNAMVEIR